MATEATTKKATKRMKATARIQSNIPLPKYTKMASSGSLANDLEKMKPGQSRIIDVDFSKRELNTVRTRVHTILKNHNLTDRKFTVNIDPVTEKKLRVWRVQ